MQARIGFGDAGVLLGRHRREHHLHAQRRCDLGDGAQRRVNRFGRQRSPHGARIGADRARERRLSGRAIRSG